MGVAPWPSQVGQQDLQLRESTNVGATIYSHCRGKTNLYPLRGLLTGASDPRRRITPASMGLLRSDFVKLVTQ
jgi:hypothetical protein